ncbi:hypothetical protein ACNOYE_28925 [Nannocystaceae bacterium ST9]
MIDVHAPRSFALSLVLIAGCFDPGDDEGSSTFADAGSSGSESGQGTDDEVGTSMGDSESGTESGETDSSSDGGESPGCVDEDQDGFGEGCEDGPDCDDGDPFNFSETGCRTCVDVDMDQVWVGCDTYGDGKQGPDCDDANPAVGADQGVEICNGLAENCAGEIDAAPADEMCPADGMVPPHVAEMDGWACEPPAPGVDGCVIANCEDEWFDANAAAGDGCECQGSSRETSNAECGGGNGGFLGVIAEGNQAVGLAPGTIPLLDDQIGNGSEDWYWVGLPENMGIGVRPNTGVVKIDFELNEGNDYRFDVFRSCDGIAFGDGLATQFGPGAPPAREWWFFDSHSLEFANQWTVSVAWPELVYVRVYRVQNPGVCNQYKLRVVRESN